ncbi:MarR family transcriptional regulator [Pelagibius sp. 7325]|uniref:MarR family winged helix-turn-helix transcriptional regulator n=1 Tax=Pelagibius sp. 7325 TaxID=3131994 RepID=UPI0030EE84BC
MDLRLETFLPYRLNRAAAVSSKHFSRIYQAEFGLTVPEWRVLATLGQIGTASATEIGQHSAMHKTKVSRAVTALQQRRWVTRETDGMDRRIEHLTLTAAGQSAFRRLAPKMLAHEDALMDRLSARERADLLRGLAVLEKALGIPVAETLEEEAS